MVKTFLFFPFLHELWSIMSCFALHIVVLWLVVIWWMLLCLSIYLLMFAAICCKKNRKYGVKYEVMFSGDWLTISCWIYQALVMKYICMWCFKCFFSAVVSCIIILVVIITVPGNRYGKHGWVVRWKKGKGREIAWNSRNLEPKYFKFNFPNGDIFSFNYRGMSILEYFWHLGIFLQPNQISFNEGEWNDSFSFLLNFLRCKNLTIGIKSLAKHFVNLQIIFFVC